MTEYKELSEYAPFKEGERFEDDEGDVLVIADGDKYEWCIVDGVEFSNDGLWEIHFSEAKVKPLDRAPQSDYNDGKWHGWNGGECPVHPAAKVDVAFNNSGSRAIYPHVAHNLHWENGAGPSDVIAFRVTKPYIEPPKPREFWINVETLECDTSKGAFMEEYHHQLIKVREEIE